MPNALFSIFFNYPYVLMKKLILRCLNNRGCTVPMTISQNQDVPRNAK